MLVLRSLDGEDRRGAEGGSVTLWHAHHPHQADRPAHARRLHSFVQYRPVPGIPIENIHRPRDDFPHRRPGNPRLHPNPLRDALMRSGPRRNVLLQRKPTWEW